MSDDPEDCEYCANGLRGSCPYWYQDPHTKEWFHQKDFTRKTVVQNIEEALWGIIPRTPDGKGNNKGDWVGGDGGGGGGSGRGSRGGNRKDKRDKRNKDRDRDGYYDSDW
ncbi:hypothetical protein [Dictyobacter formicarum]|uniref:Uncharacterized protein n=1 Tax=Dictyobacter formicarum TaxID=2778368 RepID=A0ABQ3VBH7_9CHLR|nr:hypothetical protein [Dictyobacter formicarum]GHO83003.1 hypothetical protein KSZ_10090 [Dictyobacter formicarum]